MAPTPPYTVDRIRVHYTGPFGAHTQLYHRVAGSLSQEAFVLAVRAVVGNMSQLMWNAVSFDTAEYAEASSGAYFPLEDWVAIPGGSGDDPTSASTPSAFLNWTGRGITLPPHRASLYLFEVQYQGAQDMRLQAGENAGADSVWAALRTNRFEIGNVAGQPLAWHNYTNVGQNDYLTHRARRGA